MTYLSVSCRHDTAFSILVALSFASGDSVAWGTVLLGLSGNTDTAHVYAWLCRVEHRMGRLGNIGDSVVGLVCEHRCKGQLRGWNGLRRNGLQTARQAITSSLGASHH